MVGKRWAAVVVGVLLLAGCTASANTGPTPTTPAATGMATPTPPVRSLADLGYTHTPANRIWLPAVALTYTADQPNALIAVGGVAQAGAVEDCLRTTLPSLGWTITADAPGALLFEDAEWHGAYVVGTDTWALTVRND
ncbi:MAG: hypothetical protein LBI33_09700 [Propionibacteriaceae bacterium]|nr:hypothetical protein [Propionibacteriaceae bacterium]